MSDVDDIDDLVFALLEGAGRKLCVPSWPTASPPPKSPDVPVIEARRDDEGALGVFRFATVVGAGTAPRAHFEISLEDAAALGDGVVVGDEVGVELPLHVVCAVALEDIDADALAEDVAADLNASGLKDAVVARLRLLRGPPPSSPELSALRALVTRHGGSAVRWSLSVAAHDEAPDRLVCCVARGDVSRLVVVDAVRGAQSSRRLLAAIAPTPAEHSLWRVLEREGAALLSGEGLAKDEDGAHIVVAVERVAVDDGVVVAGRHGEVTAFGRWRRSRDGRLVSEREFSVRLDIDVAALFDVVDDAALARMRAAAAVFHKRLGARFKASDVDENVFAGAAVLRVLARAMHGAALAARPNSEFGVGPDDDEEGAFGVDCYGRAFRVVPADNAVFVAVDGGFVVVAKDGHLVDGDVEAFRAVCAAVAFAIEGSEADAELVFVDDAGAEKALSLSEWLRSMGEDDVVGWLGADEVAARAWQDIVDVILDER